MTAAARPRETWQETRKRVMRQYPKLRQLANGEVTDAWFEALGGPGDKMTPLFARLMGDVFFKYGDTDGRPGPRPQMAYSDAMRRVKALAWEDYTTEPFPLALATLLDWQPNGLGRQAGRISLTSLARKTGLSRSVCYRLLVGEEDPSSEEMEAVAKAFGKHPSYFAEWRTGFLTAHVARRLESLPDTSMDLFRDLMKAAQSQ